MNRIPQITHMNSANQPACNFYLNLPVLSDINFHIGNNSLTYSDIIKKYPTIGNDSLITFLHPEVDDNGSVQSASENVVYFHISGDEIELLNETNQLALVATVSTSQNADGNLIGVKFYTDYTLDFRMGIDETGTKLNF